MGKKLTPLRIGLLGFVLLIVIGLMVYLSSKFMQYRQIGEGLVPDSTGITISITNPGSGHIAPAGVLQSISILASGPAPLLTLELWADNELVGVQAAPMPGGVSPLAASFSWLSSEPGAHVLRARTNDTGDQIAESDIVWVYISEDVNSSGETHILSTDPQPSPPSFDEPIGQAEAWAPSLGGFAEWIIGNDPSLETPVLTTQIEGCSVILLIHDNSDHELGFSVFRTPEGQTQNPTPTFVLGPHAGLGWFETTDPLTKGGLYSYVVETFTNQGDSALSNPILVNVNTEDCPPQEDEPTPYYLKLKNFFPPSNAANLYCYVSQGGGVWQRIPSVGFFPQSIITGPETGQPGIQPPELESAQPLDEEYYDGGASWFDVFTDLSLTGPGSSEGSDTIYWDCWAWVAGHVSSQGQFQVAVDTLQKGMIKLNDSEFLVEMDFEIGPIDYLDPLFPPKPTMDPQLLAPTIHFSTETSDCTNRLPGTVKPDFEIQMCHPGEDIDILNPGDLTQHPHAYLFWDLDNKINCGGPGSCIDPSDQSSLDQWGYIVSEAGYNLYDLDVSNIVPVKTFYSLKDILYIVPADESCGGVRTFKIRTFVKLFGSETVYESKGLGTILSFVEPCGTLNLVIATQEVIEMELATQEVLEAELATPEVLYSEIATPETP